MSDQFDDEDDIESLLENNSDESTIVSSCTIIYAHLMKFAGANQMNTGWVGSIGSSWKNIRKIGLTAWNHVQNDKRKVQKIIDGAVDIYVSNENSLPYDALTNVLVIFPKENLVKFKQWDELQKYMINVANARGFDEMATYVKGYDPLKAS